MILPPQPRFRFYNGIRNYAVTLRDLLTKRLREDSYVSQAEEKLAATLGVKEAILTPQGRYAIYLGVREVIRPGQTVIMSPYTLYDVVNMVIAAGGVPLFADIDRETCNISAAEVERLIDKRTGAVIVTHLHGLVSSLAEIRAICDRHSIPLLEDACQAFGAKIGERRAGTIGEMGFFSFGRAKNINAFLGGMIATNDRDKAERIRASLAALPIEDTNRLFKRIAHCAVGQILTSPLVFSTFTYWLFRYGALHEVDSVTRQFNTEINPVLRRQVPQLYERRISGLQAHLVLDQLDRVDSYSRGRLELAKIYHDGLREVPGILLPPMSTDFSHIFLSYPIQVDNRTELQRYMMEHGRDVVIQHIGNTSEFECFSEYRCDCPNARRTAASVLLLPTYPGYKQSEAHKNVEVIRRYFRTANSRTEGKEAEVSGRAA